MSQLFGFSIEERKKKEKLFSPAPPNNDDGTSVVAAGAYFGQYVDIDGIPKNNNDFDLIKKYREIALHPCLLYTSPSPRDRQKSRMPSSA